MHPYFGVTGFMSRAEVEQCLSCVPDSHVRKLMVGLLVSSTTISGRRNSLWNKFPKPQDFRKIFFKDPRAFNCLHFATREPSKLFDHLMMCVDYANGVLDGIQINIPWPDEKAIAKVMDQAPGLKLIFQLSPHMAEYEGMEFRDITDSFYKRYRDLADYVLVDFSRGLGHELRPELIYQYLIELKIKIEEHKSDIGLVIGGGLEADNVKRLIGALLNDFPQLSWDTEGKLRDDSEGGGHLVLFKAVKYINESVKLIKPVELLGG